MHALNFKADNTLDIQPSATSSHRDFDFLQGVWRVKNRKLKSRLDCCDEWLEFDAANDCHLILNGFGNTDQFITEQDGKPFAGATFRFFNPKTRLWSLYWADSNVVVLDVPQVGSFDGDIGHFYARDTFQGRPIVVMFRWDKTNPSAPVWSQAFSPDNGGTWEWNWLMNFYRR